MPVAAVSTPKDPKHRSDEGRHQRESSASVRLKAQRLRRALDADRLDDAIKIAADVAAELRSPSASELSPKGYYEVYLSVCAELRLLEMYVMESARHGAPVLELYERVQETPLVLPRLYLLVTAGSVYAKSLQAPAKDVLRDLVEMCAGVQHPQRGLFLRAYLAQMMKDKLPDALDDMSANANDDDTAGGGTVQDSIDFVIRNFTEMNRLWVRMQHDASPREMELREKERLELRLLVGSNIATLSRLVGDNLTLYRESVLPAVLEQIVSCKDAIAQEYLADCVAQVFPDDFQLATLDAFMDMCGQLVKGVNMRTILVSIVDRLTRYSASGSAGAEAARAANAFHVFRTELPDVMKGQGGSLALTDRLRIYQSLMSFALQAEPDRTDYVDDVLGFCVLDMSARRDDADAGVGVDGDALVRPLLRDDNDHMRTRRSLSLDDEILTVKVLTMPLEAFRSVGAILKLENYVILQKFLKHDHQKSLAARLLLSTNEYEPCIRDVDMLAKLFRFVAPLVRDVDVEGSVDSNGVDEGSERFDNFDSGSLTHHHRYVLSLVPVSQSANGRDVSSEEGVRIERGANATVEEDSDFERNQELVGRIVYLCEGSDVESSIRLYSALRQELLAGGAQRLAHTLPSLVLACLRLALRCGRGGDVGRDQVERLLRFIGESIDFVGSECSLLCLRLRLHVALTSASLKSCGGGRFVYDNVAEAFVAYEQEVTTSREQNTALELIISALGQCRDALEKGSFEALSTRAIKHASRTLTRSDQCVLLSRCALLFGSEMGERCVECLRKAIGAAECCVNAGERALLLLDVLDVMVVLQEHGVCDVCPADLLHRSLKQIRDIVAGRKAKASGVGKIAIARYQRVVGYIRSKSDLFESLDISEF